MSTLAVPLKHGEADSEWRMPDRGVVGMLSLIVAESAIFGIFVIAYIYYIGKSLSGPTPREVLDVPGFTTVCLLSSSFTIWLAERAILKGAMRRSQTRSRWKFGNTEGLLERFAHSVEPAKWSEGVVRSFTLLAL